MVNGMAHDDAPDDVHLFWEQAGELFCVLDAEGRFLSVNPAWTRVLGWRADQLLGRPANHLLAGGDTCATEAAERDLTTGERVIRDVENRYRHADGSIRWLRWNGFERDGRWFGTARDITASRTMDLALRVSERRARSLLEAMHDGLVVVDASGRVLEANEVFAQLVGRPAHALTGALPPYPWWPPEELAAMRGLLADFLAGARDAAETVVMHADGRRIPVHVHIARLASTGRGAEQMLLVAVRDISEVVALRDRLVEANRIARMTSWEWYPADDRMVVYGNGISPDEPAIRETTGEEALLAVPPEHRDELRRLRVEVARGERDTFATERRVTLPDGGTVWVEVRGAPIRTPEGRIVGVRGVARQLDREPAGSRSGGRAGEAGD